jgi:hypothetical protein
VVNEAIDGHIFRLPIIGNGTCSVRGLKRDGWCQEEKLSTTMPSVRE